MDCASRFKLSPLALFMLLASTQSHAAHDHPERIPLEEVRVWGERASHHATNNPASLVFAEDLASINVTTTEDMIKHEPSLIIRRRFIGDANGTLGIRGSNMFQTSRSMVFADGVPLHYFLQSRWDGAPRWTMVSASEIAQVEVLYGPFSAEHSGNAMGGVINIETAIPQTREFHLDGSFFSQSFNDYGFDDSVRGYKGFVSYGDTFGDASLYVSYNRLENNSQPQSFYYGGAGNSSEPTPVNGAITGTDVEGQPQLYFGDSGVINTLTDNLKFKVGYDVGNWSTLLNLAYEDRHSRNDDPNSYVQDQDGNRIWGGELIQDGWSFSIPSSRMGISELDRQSLSVGLRLQGELTDNLTMEANLNQFDILTDQTRSSARHPEHPEYSPAGEITDFDNTGWQTAEVKFTAPSLGPTNLSLVSGARHEAYKLNINVYQSDNYRAGQKDNVSSRSGGQTDINALFAQLDWQLSDAWDLSLGGRYESWNSRNGYFSRGQADELEVIDVPRTSRDKFSPKFSLGYQPHSDWQLRYSAARAYRFPIVEELFSRFEAFNSISEANPELKPEAGLHQNLMLERQLKTGYLRINIFQETIEDVIEAQATTLPGGTSVRTFVPLDEVETRGAEFIVNVADVIPNLDLRFNLAYTDSIIRRNSADPAIEGNRFPRMPKWRGNVMATYHLTAQWDFGGSLQYASNSFGQLNNGDIASGVYGAQDSYRFIGLKSNYRISRNLTLSTGVDNLTNELAYVAHPWPGRTLYLNFSYDI